jgi:tripartite-type tricarboxylate transporter receptor subunit TctC
LKELPDVPFATDLMGSDDDRLLMRAAVAAPALGRPFVAPPDLPADRLAALREAVMAAFADPEFMAAADKMGLLVNAPRSGPQLQEAIALAYATPPRVVERLRKLNNP